jgi:Domain of unknown function (DUF6531)/Putative Ig domain
VIASMPKTQVTVRNAYRCDVKAILLRRCYANDTDGDLLTYSLDAASVAKGMSIDQYGRITWQPKLGNVGAQAVVVTVKDPNGAQAVQNYSLAVLADTSKPVIELIKGVSLASLGETVVFQVAATDDVGIQARQLLVNGQAIALDSNGLGSYNVTSLGVLNVQAIVTDTNGNISTQETTVNVYDPTDATAPQVQLVLPSGNLTNITEVRGSVTDTNLDYYVLEVASLDSDNWREVFRGTANVTDGVLGKFDPTGLMNDTYRLRLTAYDTNGVGNSIEQEVEVAGELNLGNFRLSFTDMTIPVTGIPISLTRTYDSLTLGTTDDFGYGWRMEFRDTDLRTSLKKDPTYEQLEYRTEGFNFGTRIYITLPGGKREGFTFQPQQVQGEIGGFTGGRLYFPAFVADQGVTSKLTVPDAEITFGSFSGTYTGNLNGVLMYKGGKIFNLAGRPYVPQDSGFGNRYLLTTKDGTVYEINATSGDLESVMSFSGAVLFGSYSGGIIIAVHF